MGVDFRLWKRERREGNASQPWKLRACIALTLFLSSPPLLQYAGVSPSPSSSYFHHLLFLPPPPPLPHTQTEVAHSCRTKHRYWLGDCFLSKLFKAKASQETMVIKAHIDLLGLLAKKKKRLDSLFNLQPEKSLLCHNFLVHLLWRTPDIHSFDPLEQSPNSLSFLRINLACHSVTDVAVCSRSKWLSSNWIETLLFSSSKVSTFRPSFALWTTVWWLQLL